MGRGRQTGWRPLSTSRRRRLATRATLDAFEPLSYFLSGPTSCTPPPLTSYLAEAGRGAGPLASQTSATGALRHGIRVRGGLRASRWRLL